MQLAAMAIPAVMGGASAAASWVAPALMAGGTILSTAGQISAGDSANTVAQWEAEQIDDRAKAETAAGSREAAERAKEARLVQSRARAVGAASGGGVDYDLIGDLEEEGAYRAGIAIWESEERAKGLRTQADARRVEGGLQRSAGRTRGAATLLGGANSLMEKYG